MAAPRTPTASGISRLLASAGFERSTSSASRIKGWRNHTEGFMVVKWDDSGTVAVSYNRGLRLPSEAEAIRPRMLAGYIEAIRAADYSAKLDRDRLIVTAKDGD